MFQNPETSVEAFKDPNAEQACVGGSRHVGIFYRRPRNGNMNCRYVVDAFQRNDSASDSSSATSVTRLQVEEFLESVNSAKKKVMFVDAKENMGLSDICQDFKKTTKVLPQVKCNVYELLLVEKLVITKQGLADLQPRLFVKNRFFPDQDFSILREKHMVKRKPKPLDKDQLYSLAF